MDEEHGSQRVMFEVIIQRQPDGRAGMDLKRVSDGSGFSQEYLVDYYYYVSEEVLLVAVVQGCQNETNTDSQSLLYLRRLCRRWARCKRAMLSLQLTSKGVDFIFMFQIHLSNVRRLAEPTPCSAIV
jgi:hypothetical protein